MESVLFNIASYWDWDAKSLLLFAAVFFLTTDYLINFHPASFPPGPRPFPIVGSLFSVDHSRTHESMMQLAGKYGDVYSMRMGKVWVVVLNGFKNFKEALVNHGQSLVERPVLPMIYELNSGMGIIGSNGNLWRQQRRFALSTLRNFGLGKRSLEPVILNEFTYCLKDFQSLNGKPYNPRLIINNAVSNVICSMVFGHRYEYSNERFRKLISYFETSLQIQISLWSWFYNSFPLLMRYLPGPHYTLRHIFDDITAFIREELKEHKQNWDPLVQRDYIDCYLNEIQMSEVQANNTFSEENLVFCVLDLFVAGTETTTSTLLWAFLYMAQHPEIQAKVQAEIDEMIGQSRPPSLEDRVNVPYTDAVIHEVQRMGNTVPLSLPHFTNQEIELGGYTIPKGITVIPNLTSVLYDKNEWETPFTFNPGHFLNKEGKFVKPAAFLPFSAGKRLCPGEGLAKMELFLFFTSFMQHFTFSMPPGTKPDMNFNFSIVLSPHKYNICATPH
ncbi:cytochrome P450 2J4-like [Cheilinus undulatus]|uniref:cytochrome P450 2J4-like n=1 Tax=Cheilinus undulatus TaxID=241271 RepID=UPI001BD2C14E|nr:cytochrome P450 2J4-like [Cheilinus undulatus]